MMSASEIEVLMQPFYQLNQLGMSILGSFAGLNLVVFGWLYFFQKPPWKYFAQMNFFWNLVNMGLAVAGFMAAISPAIPLQLGLAIAENYHLQGILLLNIGLDVAYLVAGFLLVEKAKCSHHKKERWQGYGWALWLQGSFLLIFDSWMFFAHRQTSAWILNL